MIFVAFIGGAALVFSGLFARTLRLGVIMGVIEFVIGFVAARLVVIGPLVPPLWLRG